MQLIFEFQGKWPSNKKSEVEVTFSLKNISQIKIRVLSWINSHSDTSTHSALLKLNPTFCAAVCCLIMCAKIIPDTMEREYSKLISRITNMAGVCSIFNTVMRLI